MNNFIGEEIGAQELPAGAPLPKFPPAQGVIFSKVGPDGWTRKYLYKAGLGNRGNRWEQKVLIDEIRPVDQAGSPGSMALSLPQNHEISYPEPTSAPLKLPTGGMGRPLPVKMASFSGPMMGSGARMSQAFPIGGGTLPVGTPAIVPQPGTPPGMPAGPAPEPPPVCPTGPMQLPDGRYIGPDDPITLKDICELMPQIVKSLTQKPGIKTSFGYQPIGGPTAGPGGGPAGGGGGGAGFPGGGGGRARGAQGAIGTTGATGATGLGSVFDFVSKTDGDYTAGPGAFVAVPGTALQFSMAQDGVAKFDVQATLGCSQTQNGALGLRVDGTDYPLTKRLLVGSAPDVEEFYIPSSYMMPLALLSGVHDAEILLRGIEAGAECSAAGLGLSQTVSASPEAPLILIVAHNAPDQPAPSANSLMVNGVAKTDGNFTSAGLAAVPGTDFSFTVQVSGLSEIKASATVNRAGGTSVADVVLGVRVDGTDYTPANINIQNGSGADEINTLNLSFVLPLDLSVGSHTVQMLYAGGGATFDLVASASTPASLSVIHS